MANDPVGIPEWFWIGPARYTTRLLISDPADQSRCLGSHDGDTHSIAIRDGLGPQTTLLVLLHEIFHGIEQVWKLDLGENVVDSLAYGWMGIMRDNPDLMEAFEALINRSLPEDADA